MTLLQILIVLFAAILHASWNVAAKFGSDAGNFFVFAYNFFSFVFFFPLVLFSIYSTPLELSLAVVIILFLTAALHLLYGVVLLKGYQKANLSVVYPVARGTGPLITCVVAIFLFNEQLKSLEVIGVIAICVGVILIATRGSILDLLKSKRGFPGLRWGILIGFVIASYSITDAFAVKNLLLAPILIGWMSSVGGALLFVPTMLKNAGNLREQMIGKWKYAVYIGFASPLAYTMILFALQLGANVSVVAPLRESSMLFGTLVAMLLFKEKVTFWAWVGCISILIGVVSIAY